MRESFFHHWQLELSDLMQLSFLLRVFHSYYFLLFVMPLILLDREWCVRNMKLLSQTIHEMHFGEL